jgi:uncharacterized lipoprotein
MKKVLITAAMLTALAACSGSNQELAAPDEATAEAAPAAAPAAPETPAAAAAPAAAGDYKAGDTVVAGKQTTCSEVGPEADETPWDIYPGVTKTVIAVQGDKLRVAVGDTECLMPAADVKPG